MHVLWKVDGPNVEIAAGFAGNRDRPGGVFRLTTRLLSHHAADGAYRIADTRVSLDSLVYLFREGMSAESMVESYPALTLEQVHGALAFYLHNQSEVDAHLPKGSE